MTHTESPIELGSNSSEPKSEQQENCSANGKTAPPTTMVALKDEFNNEIGKLNSCFHHFRYIIIVLAGIMMGSMLFLRLNISVAMISMVNKTAIYLNEHPNSTADDYFAPDYVETGQFVWTNEIQQIIMTGYMVAYALPQGFTTRIALNYGVRLSIALSLSLCGLASLLTPIFSYWGWEWVLLLRLINALGASPVLPSMVNVIEQWMPYEDAAKGVAIFQFTSNIVYTLTPLISGYLTSVSWKLAFYVPGAIGLAIGILWYTLASDSPESSKFISQREYNLINGLSADSATQSKQAKPKPDLPWHFMFRIKEFYFITICWTLYCSTVGGFLFLLPTYLNRVLNVPVEEVGLLNFTVQIGNLFCMLWPAPFSSFLQNKYGLSLTNSRRIIVFVTTGCTIATYCCLAVNHDNLISTIAINRFFHMTNDTIILATLMSQYGKAGLSGLVYSMMNAFGNSATVVLCWAAGRALDYTGETLDCWSWILYALSALMAAYFIFYLLTCKSEPIEVRAAPGKCSAECGTASDSKLAKLGQADERL